MSGKNIADDGHGWSAPRNFLAGRIWVGCLISCLPAAASKQAGKIMGRAKMLQHSPSSTGMIMFLLVLAFYCRIFPSSVLGEDCPKCGNTTVPFPLSTSPSCGQPAYAISCNQSRLELKTMSGFYPIQSIDPRARKLVISSKPLVESTCTTLDASTDGGLLLNRSLAFNVTSSNTVMLLNCSSILLRSPLNCSESSICHQYIDTAPQARSCKSSKLCCTFTAGGSSTSYRIRATTDGSACSAYVSVVNLNPALGPSNWNYGVELEWMVPKEPPCSNPRQSCGNNATCRLDNTTSNSYRCLCNSGYRWDSYRGVCSTVEASCIGSSTGCGNTGADHTGLIAGLTSALAALALAVALVMFIVHKKRVAKEAQMNRAREFARIMSTVGGKPANIYSAKEMKRATNGFSKDRLLGSGGFGEVYKGTLDDGTVVAIKLAKLGNIKGRDQVINEVCILSQVNHRNLVRIWGCCVDTGEPLLVYEYVPNGTLHDWLHGNGNRRFLGWRTRLGIALQTAEGLAYLHSAAYPPIYHRDVKSSNILLDELLDARVSDFGLSRLAQPDISHVSTCAQGTLGYLDPEYYRNYQLTDKSDVYSFGVVLLELVTSQRAIDFSREQDEVNLAVYVTDRTARGQIMDVVDGELLECRAGVSEVVVRESIVAVIMLALSCLQESRLDRPTMKEVAEELNYIISTYDDATDRYQDKHHL